MPQLPKTNAIWVVAVQGSTETLESSAEKAGFCRSPRIALCSLCQELQHRSNVMVEITHPVDHEVQSLSHFTTESFSVGIDQLTQSLLVEGARADGEPPCVERSLDVHHSLRSLPL